MRSSWHDFFSLAHWPGQVADIFEPAFTKWGSWPPAAYRMQKTAW